MLKHASLFSGIGGFDLAATWVGWENVFTCEKHPFCNRILKYHWPETHHHEDIYQFNAAPYRGGIDIISGGFPCQPFSYAGRRKGKTDDRYLWPETRRIITEVRPEWVVLENVAGLFTILEPESLSQMEIKTIELFCKDGEQAANSTIVRLQRRVIGSIISEIGTAGYSLPRLEDGTPVVLCIPACAINAPHRRDRVWFVAHADFHTDRQDGGGPGNPGTDRKTTQKRQEKTGIDHRRPDQIHFSEWSDPNSYGNGQHFGNSENAVNAGEGRQHAQHDPNQAHRFAADAYGKGLEGAAGKGDQGGNGDQPAWFHEVPGWDEWPAQSPVCSRNDGVPRTMDGITFSKWRTESIKAFGNAIVPQIALELFRSIAKVNVQ